MYIAARDQVKSERAIEELKISTGKEAVFLKLDLASLKAIKTAAEEFLRSTLFVHESDVWSAKIYRQQGDPVRRSYQQCVSTIVLKNVLPAHVRVSGVMFAPTSYLTSDGYDLQFGTNVLGKYMMSSCRAL